MRSNGLWINDKTFVNFQDKQPSLTTEIATRKGSIDFFGLSMYLPNPDAVLKKQGKDIAVYKELLTDAHVGGCITSRKSGCLSLEWSIDRGKAKSRQASIIEAVFKSLDIEKIISEMLEAILYGYQALEVIWEAASNSGLILPKAVIGKPQRWFVFDADNRLRLKTDRDINGMLLPERKFLLIQHDSQYDNPYGFPSLSRCFWPVTFKKGGLKFWVMFTEKYGMPFLIGKQPRGSAQADTDKLLEQLSAMVQDAVAVIPDDSSVAIEEAAGKSASADIYDKLIQYCDTQISIALLGQNLTTKIQGGSYAAAQSHMQVRKDIIESDKRLIEKAFNTLIKWIYEINFQSSGGGIPVFSMYEQEDVDKTLAERDKILVDAGVRFSLEYFKKAYGFEDKDLAPAQTTALNMSDSSHMPYKSSASAFPDQQAIDDIEAGLTPAELQDQMERVLKPITDLINSYSPSYLRGGQGELSLQTYNALMEKLLETYPDMDTEAIEDMLARAIFVSELWGRLSAKS